MGRIERIWVKRAQRGPMDAVEAARLVEGRGLEGSAFPGGRRQVTIVSVERWRALTAPFGAAVDPVVRRANLLVSGLDLEDTRGRALSVGGCVLRIGGETRPCERMDGAVPGLQAAMRPRWGGGAWAMVERGGLLTVGDAISWIDASS